MPTKLSTLNANVLSQVGVLGKTLIDNVTSLGISAFDILSAPIVPVIESIPTEIEKRTEKAKEKTPPTEEEEAAPPTGGEVSKSSTPQTQLATVASQMGSILAAPLNLPIVTLQSALSGLSSFGQKFGADVEFLIRQPSEQYKKVEAEPEVGEEGTVYVSGVEKGGVTKATGQRVIEIERKKVSPVFSKATV